MIVAAPYDRVVGALIARKSRRMGSNWTCPCHDDRTPSLSVNPATHRETGEPTVLLKCQAGCSTTEEILPALGIEPSELFGNGHRPLGLRQERLFPAERFSPVRRSGWLALPPSVARNFGVASTFGRLLVVDGTFRRVASTNETLAIVLNRKDRQALRDVLGISPNQLRNEVVVWRQSSMAHACSYDLLTLFVRPEQMCAYCKAQPSNGALGEREQPTGGALLGDSNSGVALLGTELHQPTAGSLKGCSDGESEMWESYPELKALEWLKEDTSRRRR